MMKRIIQRTKAARHIFSDNGVNTRTALKPGTIYYNRKIKFSLVLLLYLCSYFYDTQSLEA